MNEAATDRRLLTREAYPDSTNLNARSSIYEFKTPVVDIWDWVFEHAAWDESLSVLDVGCGPGRYLARVKGVGVDLSFGMAREARAHAPTAVGDVCALPVATGSVDRLLAPHMLYHAPDLDQGASELRRVLRPGGVALVVTNDRSHVWHLVEQLCAASGTEVPIRFIDRFTLENGLGLLERHFDEVTVDHLVGELLVPYVDPVVNYADSCRSLYETQLPDGINWEDTMRGFAELVEHEIEHEGAWRCETHSGVFVCK